MKPLFRDKVQLTPILFPVMKSNSFPNYFCEKNISTDKIPAILQVFKVVISCPMTEHSGIWVGLLVTSWKDIAQNTQEMLDWILSTVKTHLGYLCFIFIQKWTRLLNERTLSSRNTIWSLATVRTTMM